MSDSVPIPHLLSRIYNTPLMITGTSLEMIINVLERKMAGEDIRLAAEGAKVRESKPYSVRNGVAVVPVIGEITQRDSGLNAMSGMASYAGLEKNIMAAVADPDVHTVALEIDSPGGEVAGCFGLCERIRALARQKPIVSVVSDQAASAAYAIAAATNRIYASPTSILGSIGVIYAHKDFSKAEEARGIKTTYFSSGERKTDTYPIPLSDEARAAHQESVDAVYDEFVASVVRNRRLSEKQVRDQQAGIYIGKAAIKAGLADEIGTFESVLNALAKGASGSSLKSGLARRERNMSWKDKILQALSTAPDDEPSDAEESMAQGELLAPAIMGFSVLDPGNNLTVTTHSASNTNPSYQARAAVPDPQVVELQDRIAQMEADYRRERATTYAATRVDALIATDHKVYPAQRRCGLSFVSALHELCAAHPELTKMANADGAVISMMQGFEDFVSAAPSFDTLLGERVQSNTRIVPVTADGKVHKPTQADTVLNEVFGVPVMNGGNGHG